MSPREIFYLPRVEKELLEGLKYVLDTLVVRIDTSLILDASAHPVQVAHEIPLYHRDKASVGEYYSQSGRFVQVVLIDWAADSIGSAIFCEGHSLTGYFS